MREVLAYPAVLLYNSRKGMNTKEAAVSDAGAGESRLRGNNDDIHSDILYAFRVDQI